MIPSRLAFLEKLSFACLCALMADCCIFGAGRVVMVGPLSIRMLLFGLTIITAVPSMLRQWRSLLTNKILWAFAVWLAWLAISAVAGMIRGNSIYVMITDLKGFAYFAILPAVVCLIPDRARTHTLMKVMMYASGVLGVVMLVHFALYLWAPKTFMVLYEWGISRNFSAIARITATMPRLFFYSTNYLLVGCAFATYFQVIHQKLRLDMSLLTGINLVCLLMSYTRSVYLAVGVAIVVLVLGFFCFMGRTQAKRFWTHICLSVVAFCLVLSAFGIATKTEYISYALTRTLLSFEVPAVEAPVPEATEDVEIEITEPTEPIKPVDPETQAYQEATIASDQLRGNIQAELLKLIRKSPVIGNGLGAAIEWRAVNEYFFLDLTAKTGVIGLILYFCPLLTAAVLVLKKGKENGEGKFRSAAWVSVLLGFMAFSYFNPYMNAALGVLFYSCTLAAVNAASKYQ